MMQAKIYCPVKSSMQSGKANCKKWVLEFLRSNSKFIEPLMGWTGSADTKGQLKIKFATKEEAIDYANRKKINFEVVEPKQANTIIKTYAHNFTRKR